MQRSSEQIPQEQHDKDRIQRAYSWLKRSDQAGAKLKEAEANLKHAEFNEDVAALYYEQFIFLWIAFNAAYGRELLDDRRGDYPTESQKFNEFLAKILERDTDQVIKNTLLETYGDTVHFLLKNFYVFGPFWRYVRSPDKAPNWENKLKEQNRSALSALNGDDIHTVLREVFSRLHVLRNQLFHGGATFATGWGRPQVRDGSRIMASLVPAILGIMKTDIEENPASDIWGAVAYPRVNEAPDQ